LDAVDETVSIIPTLQDEIRKEAKQIKEMIELMLPRNDSSPAHDVDRPSSVERYNAFVAAAHEKIDETFSTDQAKYYTPAAKEAVRENVTLGVIPVLPAAVGISFSIDQLASAGKALDRGGFTKAGRALVKHGYRKHTAFPKPRGNVAQINEHGQKVLEALLNHPEKVIETYTHYQLGPVIDVMIPGKGGVRFTAEGQMIGFLQPKRK
jgi:hypothetical protein